MDSSDFPLLAASAEGRHTLPHLLRTAFDSFERRSGGPLPAGHPQQILRRSGEKLGAAQLPKRGMGPEEALRTLGGLLSQNSIDLSHPLAAAHLQPPVVSAAVAADALASMTNASMDTFDSGPASIAIERWVIRVLADMAGLSPKSVGVMTPGGSMSNLLALMCARDCAGAKQGLDTRRNGTGVLGWPVVLCSELAHFSVHRAAAALGLGERSVVSVPTDGGRAMDVAALRRTVARLRPEHTIIGVVATAGTTDFGAFDPISEIKKVCESFGLWLHVDAAYGFGALFSEQLAPLAEGIDCADSITLDLHKLGWVPAAASALLVRDAASFLSLERYPDYLYPEDEVASGYEGTLGMSLQTTRRADSLKVAATMLACGRDGLGKMVDKCHALAKHAESRIEENQELELVFPVRLSTVVFRYQCEASNQVNAEIRSRLLASGEALIARTKVDNKVCLKLTLLNPHAAVQDIDEILRMVVHEGRRSLRERRPRVRVQGGAA